MHVTTSLPGVRALLFDVFGTVVDWHAAIVAHLRVAARGTVFHNEDWAAFAADWRAGYIRTTLHVARGGAGPATVDEMHRQLLDELLDSPRWSMLAPLWGDPVRRDLVLAWHRLHGWPDATPGLYALKSLSIIGTLSNGNVRLLVDMAKYADLPWDVVFSSELFASYKPNPKIYLGAVRALALEPHQVALVASHIHDCAAAKACGLKAVYVRRPTEDRGAVVDESIPDVIVDDFHQLARLMRDRPQDPELYAKL
ncbi:haloacid dehalogenase [Gautieria morchelliformis]|nr:haloacid dehalogenase [Gautieria morchelliformis]